MSLGEYKAVPTFEPGFVVSGVEAPAGYTADTQLAHQPSQDNQFASMGSKGSLRPSKSKQELQWLQSRQSVMGSVEPAQITCRDWVGSIFVKGDKFQSFVALVIVLNAATIGLETDVTDLMWLWDYIEDTFLFIFTIELLLRIYYWRLHFFTGQEWVVNLFDSLLVFAGLLDFVMTVIFNGSLGSFSMWIRVCRLLRILRLFRLFKMFKQLYMLASGFAESSVAVFWVSVLCSLFLYVCAVFLTRTLGHIDRPASKSNDVYGDSPVFYKDKFGSVAISMFTLFELMADPNLTEMKALMFHNPGMMCFFIVFIIFGSFAMLSILTGVISEGMIEKGNLHKEEMRFEEERKKNLFLTQLAIHFQESDVDGDGTLTREEFIHHLPRLMEMFEEQGFVYADSDLEMVFDLVDFDKGGTVELDEFLQGMTSFTANVTDLPLQVLRLQSNIFMHVNKLETKLETRMDSLDARALSVDQKMEAVDTRLQGIDKKLSQLITLGQQNNARR